MKSPSLLFLHGAGTANKNRAEYLQEEIKDCGIESYSFNFSGHSGIDLEESSLEKRYKEAKRVIKELNLKKPLSLFGSSMGAYIAIKLLEEFEISNLILFCPALYSSKAFNISFGPNFTKILREINSWKNSDAFEIIKNFKGNLRIFIGEKDEVVPKQLIEMLDENSRNTSSKKIIIIPQATHALHQFISENKMWKARVKDEICQLLN